MRIHRRLAPVLALALGAAACARGMPRTEPGTAAALPVAFRFEWRGALTNSAGADGAALIPGNREIQVSGDISTPTRCTYFGPEARLEGQRVTLVIHARPNRSQACAEQPASYPYEATVRGLPPGGYVVRVEYEYPGSGWGRKIVLEHPVDVGG
jgi:hypothetical protein